MKVELHPLVAERCPAWFVSELVRFVGLRRTWGATKILLMPQLGSMTALWVAPSGKGVYPGCAFKWSGWAWQERRQILIRVPVRRNTTARYTFAGTPGGPSYQGNEVEGFGEALLHMLAHEMRHIWQARRPWARRFPGCPRSGAGEERDADLFAFSVVLRWRAATGRNGTNRGEL